VSHSDRESAVLISAGPGRDGVTVWIQTAALAPALFAAWRRRGATTPIIFNADAVNIAAPEPPERCPPPETVTA
jgi:hypothetical protein